MITTLTVSVVLLQKYGQIISGKAESCVFPEDFAKKTTIDFSLAHMEVALVVFIFFLQAMAGLGGW